MKTEFKYTRHFLVKDLLDASQIFDNTNTLEFDCFKSFFKWFVTKQLFNDCNIKEIILPVETKQDIETLKKLDSSRLPLIKLRFPKKPSLELISSLDTSLKKVSIIIDGEDVLFFKELLKKVPKETLNFLRFNSGTFVITIDFEDIDNIIYKITDPFFTLPFFSCVKIEWNFENLEKKVTIDRLHAIIWHLNFLKINVLNRSISSKITWNDFLQEDKEDVSQLQSKTPLNDYSKYKLYLDKSQEKSFYKYFYITETSIFFNKDIKKTKLPSFLIEDFINKDANEKSLLDVNKLRSIIDQPIKQSYFSTWEQNYRCNKSIAQESYLNILLNNILVKGSL